MMEAVLLFVLHFSNGVRLLFEKPRYITGRR